MNAILVVLKFSNHLKVLVDPVRSFVKKNIVLGVLFRARRNTGELGIE
jgi:hypothetical protein